MLRRPVRIYSSTWLDLPMAVPFLSALPCGSADAMNVSVRIRWTVELNDPADGRKIYGSGQRGKSKRRAYPSLVRRYPWQTNRRTACDRIHRRWTCVSFDPWCRTERVRADQDGVCIQRCRGISPVGRTRMPGRLASLLYLLAALNEDNDL